MNKKKIIAFAYLIQVIKATNWNPKFQTPLFKYFNPNKKPMYLMVAAANIISKGIRYTFIKGNLLKPETTACFLKAVNGS